MVEKLKKIKTKQIVIFSVLAFMLVLVVGTTYAYFTAKVIGNDEAKDNQVYAGIMSLKLDGTQELNASNMLPGATKEVEFSVENTGTLTTTYELDMKEVYNDFANKEDLVYTLEQDGNVITTEIEAPSIDEILIPAVVIEPNEKQTYKLKLTFKETGKDQNTNQNKTFTGKIQISGIDSSNYLQAKVLARSINTQEPNLNSSDPSYLSKEKKEKNKDENITSLVTDNMIIGDSYTFDEQNGFYTLTNIKKNQTFNKSTVGKYTCGDNTSHCKVMYKINDVVDSQATEKYNQKISVNTSQQIFDSKVADSYHFDQETGQYVLENESELRNFEESDIGKYTCGYFISPCNPMYKINAVTEKLGVTNADVYYASLNINKITNADEYTSTLTSTLVTESGLYKAKDEDGDSYYFRGKIDNNYVSFANNLWRIVRINGDGSIRLIHASDIGDSKFNSKASKSSKAGYTYDNESNCTKENPCISDYDQENNVFTGNKTMTNSEMKTYLENWYADNLKEYNDKIVLQNYCNDTTIFDIETEGETFTGFGSTYRYNYYINPILTCPDTTENYGGNYKLKIGLLTTDESRFAGVDEKSNNAISNNYLNYNSEWFQMSPDTTDSIRRIYISTIINSKLSPKLSAQLAAVRPVINLKSDIQITGGDGSKSNPYTVE